MGNEEQLGASFTGRQIRELRKDLGLELKDVQARLEEHGCTLSLSTLSRMETGKGRGPTVDELLALALIFDVTPNRLLFGPDAELTPAGPLKLWVTETAGANPYDVWQWAAGEDHLENSWTKGQTGTEALMDALIEQVRFQRRNRLNHPPSTVPPEVRNRLVNQDDAVDRLREAALSMRSRGLDWIDISQELHNLEQRERHERARVDLSDLFDDDNQGGDS